MDVANADKHSIPPAHATRGVPLPARVGDHRAFCSFRGHENTVRAITTADNMIERRSGVRAIPHAERRALDIVTDALLEAYLDPDAKERSEEHTSELQSHV